MRKGILGVILSVVLSFQIMGLTVMAAENPDEKTSIVVTEDLSIREYPQIDATYGTMMISSDGFVSANIFLSYDSNGLLAQFSTAMTKQASVVGVRDIKIYQSVWYGWKEVGKSGGGYATNIEVYACGVTYTGASAGETYKASCVHYATIDGVNYERPNETIGFTCVDPNN